MDLATLFVRFKADTSDVDKSVKTLEANTKKSAGNIAKVLAGAFGAAAIGAGIKKSIDAASDLNETVSKTEVIFGSASAAIEKNADTAAKSMGLSKRAYLDAAGGLKGLLDNLGLTRDESTKYATQLTQLGSDLASFFNTDPSDAINAIGSALRGEQEPIRAYNVNISEAAVKTEALKEGLYDGTGAIDAHAKAQATLALIMQQTTAAQGDFARTADGAANSQRTTKAEAENAAASFGQVLLPVYTQVVKVVGDMAAIFGSLPGPVQTAIIALAGLVALSGPLGSMVELVQGIGEAMSGLAVSAGGLALVAAGVAAVAVLFSSSDDTAKQVAARSKEVAVALQKETDEIARQRQEAGQGATAAQAYADAQLALSKALTGADEKGQRLSKALGALGLQTSDAADLVGLLKVNADDMAFSQEDLATATAKGADASHLAAIKQRDLAVALLESKGISADVAKVLVEAGQGASDMGDAADVTKDKTKGWTDANKALFQSIIEVGKQAGGVDLNTAAQGALNAEVATNKYNASLVAQAEAQAGASRNSDQAQSVLAAYQSIVDNLTPAQEALRTGTDALAASTAAATTTTVAATDAADAYAVAQDIAKARSDANSTATANLAKSLQTTATKADRAKQAADDFGKALDAVFGGSLDLETANRNLQKGFDDLAASAKDNGKTLDINTEKGRANRQAVQDQVQAILDQAKANIAAGASTTDATNASLLYTQQLEDQLTKLGFNKDEVAAYIAQLGLTPDSVKTAIELQNEQDTKTRLQGLLDQLGDIDAGAAAEIQADIDQGKFDAAEKALDQLARNRPVLFVPSGSFVSGNVAGPRAGVSDIGRYVPRGGNFLTYVSKNAGMGDEVILPLDNPARIRQLAAGNNVGSRILDALADANTGPTPVAAAATSPVSTTSSSSMVGLHVDHLEIHDDTSAQSLAQIVAFKMAGI